MLVVTEVMMIPKTLQTREITMKKNLTPIDLKTFFYMIVTMSYLSTTLVLIGHLHNS